MIQCNFCGMFCVVEDEGYVCEACGRESDEPATPTEIDANKSLDFDNTHVKERDDD